MYLTLSDTIARGLFSRILFLVGSISTVVTLKSQGVRLSLMMVNFVTSPHLYNIMKVAVLLLVIPVADMPRRGHGVRAALR